MDESLTERKIELPAVSGTTYEKTGELILMFAAVEWVIANAIHLPHYPPENYELMRTTSLADNHLALVFRLSFSQKLGELRRIGYDTATLREIGEYRNALSHGLIFDRPSGPTIKRFADPNSQELELNGQKLESELERLRIEGGRLLNFLKAKGYNYFIK